MLFHLQNQGCDCYHENRLIYLMEGLNFIQIRPPYLVFLFSVSDTIYLARKVIMVLKVINLFKSI